MTNNKQYKAYRKTNEYSYAFGIFAVYELLACRPDDCLAVLLHPDLRDAGELTRLCRQSSIPLTTDARLLARVGAKDSCLAAAVLRKYETAVCPASPHLLLANPADRGNLGTIARTAAGLGLPDLAVITPAADIWHPKTIRASMGALFRIRFQRYPSFEAYRSAHPGHRLYPFLLEGTAIPEECSPPPLFTLLFGNEATGLNPCFAKTGTPVRIPQSGLVDSLNLASAVSIGAYHFARKAGLV